jgi:hypothetical protein
VKFCYITSIPPDVNPMKKGAVSTHKGFVNGAFAPYHGDVNISLPSDISEADLLKAVSSVKKSDVKK